MGRTWATGMATALLLGLVGPATAVQPSTGGTLVAEGTVVHGNGKGARATPPDCRLRLRRMFPR